MDFAGTALLDELLRIGPSEILANTEMHLAAQASEALIKLLPWPKAPYDEGAYSELNMPDALISRFGNTAIEELGAAELCAAAALMRYLEATQKNGLRHINVIKHYELQQYMQIDPSARRNLELTQTMRGMWHSTQREPLDSGA
jgi:DNA mismatch repair protein MutS